MKDKEFDAEEVIKGDDGNAIPNANGVVQNHPSEAGKPLDEKSDIVITLTPLNP